MNKEEIVRLFLEHNFNISIDALDFLIQNKTPKEVIKQTIKELPLDTPVINLNVLKEIIETIDKVPQKNVEKKTEIKIKTDNFKDDHLDLLKQQYTNKEITKERIKRTKITPISQEYSLDITIKLDIPEKTIVKPDTLTFRKFFQNRFEKLSNIIIKNLSDKETVLRRNLSIDEVPRNRSGIIIGMVQDTRVLHTGKFVIQLEDPEIDGSTNCVMVQDSESFPEYREISRDSVIGISGILPKNYREGVISAFWGKDIIRPSFSPVTYHSSSSSHRILFIADIHFGSKYFSQRIFTNLVKFLMLKDLSPENETIASEIDVIIIAGDLVDGIGRFPNQKDQISLKSIQNQYNGLAKLLIEIPSHIEIIIIPGEHDATQVALPQPAIDKKIADNLIKLPNIRNHGNPLRLTIDQTDILVYHGQGSETLFQKQTRLKSFNPIPGLQNLLEYRHLCPEYGSTTPIAPFNTDYLVIDEIPEVFVTGHFHRAFFHEYKGVKIITCGTFQKYQHKEKSMIKNDFSLGILPILNTNTGKVDMIDLKKQ